MKWAKGGWPLPLPVSGLHRAAPGAVPNVLQGCLPVRGSRNAHQLQLHPGSSHSCTPSSTWEGAQKGPGGAPAAASVPQSTLWGVGG